MPKHGKSYPKAHKARVARITQRPFTRSERASLDDLPTVDLVKHHSYTLVGVPATTRHGKPTTRLAVASTWDGAEDRPTTTVPGLVARNWITVPPRTRGTLADAWTKPSRMSFTESVIAAHDPHIARPQAGYTEVRPPVVIGFTGKRSDTPEATDRQGQAMRDSVEVAWETHHAPLVSGNALREGRPRYRAGRTQLRSTTKLGDFAGD